MLTMFNFFFGTLLYFRQSLLATSKVGQLLTVLVFHLLISIPILKMRKKNTTTWMKKGTTVRSFVIEAYWLIITYWLFIVYLYYGFRF